jgi:hypothetical protein
MSVLTRRDEEAVPSRPLPSMRTAMALFAPVVVPRMPAMNVAVCVPAVPSRIYPDSVRAPPLLPM